MSGFKLSTQGRATVGADLSVHLSEREGVDLHYKMRQAYWWIVNNAVMCPYYDLEFGPSVELKNGAGDTLQLHEDMSYSSFVLMPMLTLFTCRRALLVGGPGRGKTTAAILMALVSGMPREELRRTIQRGHPQLSIADLLGSPLPSDMLKAEDMSQVKIGWRKWISARVKIVDEYNRIPTKTQSALLSLMAEGYAEMFDQFVYAGKSSWFMTANDDSGGGTFQVIEALKDRIDVVVRAVPFNSGFLKPLLRRVEADKQPEELVPAEIIFTAQELEQIYKTILAMALPDEMLEKLGFFLGQLDFCRMASPQFEAKSKDTLKLHGQTVSQVCTEQCPLDKKVHLCTQTENGVSARAYQTALHYAKALAYFRGHPAVDEQDLRQIVPFVLHDKLTPNARSPFFEVKQNRVLLGDRVAWIRAMWDKAMDQYGRHEPLRRKVRELRAQMDQGLEGVDKATAEKRSAQTSALLEQFMQKHELSGPIYEDLIQLKALLSRTRNYLHWVVEKQRR